MWSGDWTQRFLCSHCGWALHSRSPQQHTHTCRHAHRQMRESFLSLLNGEDDTMTDSKHPRWVSHVKIKLMAFSDSSSLFIFRGLPGRSPDYYHIMKPTGLTCKFNLKHDPKHHGFRGRFFLKFSLQKLDPRTRGEFPRETSILPRGWKTRSSSFRESLYLLYIQ